MYFWYYYQESYSYGGGEYDDSIFGNGLCKNWEEMLNDIVNFVFDLKRDGQFYRFDYSKICYINKDNFNIHTLHPNFNLIDYLRDRVDELYEQYLKERKEKSDKQEKYKKIKTSIDTIKSVNRDITDEELMNILKISPEVLDEYYSPPF